MKQRAQNIFLVIVLFLYATSLLLSQKVVRYDLHIRDTIFNFSGKNKRGIAVNGQIPMPTLQFTEGDTAEIHVYNHLKESTSLHWHGIFLPNQEDGVPYLTQMPIKPNTTHIYRFPIIQNGTHWYHSHSGFQEQLGMYGSLILLKKETDSLRRTGIDDIKSIPIILSEWTDLNPKNVHRLLHNATDWFSIKKGSTQSYAEAIRSGYFKTKLTNEWKRMSAMDVSDIYYDKFLINGKAQQDIKEISPGQKVRLRISNGGASTYFWLHFAGGKMTVVANDGNDVEPVQVSRLLIGVSETYDVIIEMPDEEKAFEFVATAEDRSSSTSVFLGKGVKQLANPLQKLQYFEGMKMMNNMMKVNGEMDDMGMNMSLQQMDMNSVMYPEMKISNSFKQAKKSTHTMSDHSDHNNKLNQITTLNYNMFKSTIKTNFESQNPTRELYFELTGNMNRYLWTINNKSFDEVDKILIRKGEILRIILHNNSMMRHPMHLHGHDFRVLNQFNEFSPLKNVIDIMPMETDTIEFEANMEGDWFFHCHILYHMMSGMNRVFSYEQTFLNPYLPNKKRAYQKLQKESNPISFMFQNDIATNGNDGMAMVHNARWSIGTEWRLGYNNIHGYETETHFGRYFGKRQWLYAFVGFDWRYRQNGHDNTERNIFGQKNTKNSRSFLSAGFAYTLPLLITIQAEVYHTSYFRLQLKREDIPVSKRFRLGFMVNSDKEYMIDLNYIIYKNLAIRTHYDSDMGFGIGARFSY